MTNATMVKFGFPGSLVRDYRHWVALLRPQQVTLGSLVLVAKSDATAFGGIPPAAHAELATITADIEAMLAERIAYQRINYLMLMMVDPHVHFHIFPRYEGVRDFDGQSFADTGWPGPPNLPSGRALDEASFEQLRQQLSAVPALN